MRRPKIPRPRARVPRMQEGRVTTTHGVRNPLRDSSFHVTRNLPEIPSSLS